MDHDVSIVPRVHPQLGNLNNYACGAESVMSTWLGLPSVMAALHVRPNSKSMNYIKTAGDLLPLYAQLIAKYRLLIYSGDVCNRRCYVAGA